VAQALLSGQVTQSPLKALVHNAGSIELNEFEKTSDSEWERQFNMSVMAPVRLTRRLLPLLKESRGSIVNVSSTLGLKPVPLTSAYSALKAAMINWSQALAIEMAPFGVRVNCVCPGFIDTPIHNVAQKDKKLWLERIEDLIPLGRIGQPKDVSRAITFYLDDENSWTTGNIHVVDGGLSLK